MKEAPVIRFATCLLCVCMLGLAACGRSAPVHFYTLNSLSRAGSHPLTNSEMPAIGVGPVSMPGYLDRLQMVTRSDQSRLEINDYVQWAETPKTAILRVLTENLSALLASNNVFAFPWRREARIRYQVVINVDRFDGQGRETAVLEAGWAIIDTDRHKILTKQKTAIREPAQGGGYGALVEAHSRALAKLSRRIADAFDNVLKQAN